MKWHFKILLFALLALAAVFFSGAVTGRANAEPQQQKPAAQAQAQEPEPEYSEDEYNAYDSASKEPDLLKRGTMLLEFIDKYPKSKLMSFADSAYKSLLYECSNNKKYQELETLAEKWLKLHANDLQTIAYIADAADKLGHNEKCVQCLLQIYQMQPTGSMAYNIAQTYKKMNNTAKYLEWTDTVFKYPEYDSNYKLRYDLVQTFVDAKDFAKAADYARMTLKAADLVKQPDSETQAQLRGVRRACYHLIGMSLFEKDKFPEAIKALEQALKAEKYGEGYYYIGLCLWKQDKVEEAMLYFARAEQQGGEIAPKAKEKLEQLYKALHNNTLIGIDKIYKRAKEQPESAG
jgi:tetratricopeptide (TPR) repeat protein